MTDPTWAIHMRMISRKGIRDPERLTMHRKQPTHPKKVSFSLRKKDESIADTTTESAPRGVWGRVRGESGVY
jgi:hypothetical protein